MLLSSLLWLFLLCFRCCCCCCCYGAFCFPCINLKSKTQRLYLVETLHAQKNTFTFRDVRLASPAMGRASTPRIEGADDEAGIQSMVSRNSTQLATQGAAVGFVHPIRKDDVCLSRISIHFFCMCQCFSTQSWYQSMLTTRSDTTSLEVLLGFIDSCCSHP